MNIGRFELAEDLIERIESELKKELNYTYLSAEFKDFLYCEKKYTEAICNNNECEAERYQRMIPERYFHYHLELLTMHEVDTDIYDVVISIILNPGLSYGKLSTALKINKTTVYRRILKASRKYSIAQKILYFKQNEKYSLICA